MKSLDAMTFPRRSTIKREIHYIRFLGDPRSFMERDKEALRLYPGKQKNTYYVSETTLQILQHLHKKIEILRSIPPEKSGIDIAFPMRTILHDLPGDELREEIVALALSRKALGKKCYPVYEGRTRDILPGTFIFDRPGGSRSYRWRWERSRAETKAFTLPERFAKLVKEVSDPETRFVLSLGSGGLRMFAHASIFNLIEAMGVRENIEEIWGTSGGAIAGLAYALGAEHQVMEKEGYDIYHKKFDLKLGPSTPEVIKNLLMNRLLPGTTLSFKGFVDIQNSLQASLARITRHQKPQMPFYAMAYNMDLRQSEVLTPERIAAKRYEGFIRRCSPLDCVVASAAIPILFTPKVIRRGKASFTYIDGGVFEEVPLISVYHKWKLDRKMRATKKKKLFILAVNLFPFLSSWKFLGTMMTKYVPILELLGFFSRLADLARRAHIDDHIRTINNDPDAVVYEIGLPRMSHYNFVDPKIIPIVIDKAHGTFFDQLLRIEDKL